MLAVYAVGSGLGHRTRVARALAALGLEAEERLVIEGPPETIRAIGPRLAASGADHLLVDTFPAGFAGELTADAVAGALGPDVEVTLLARRLRWDAYRPVVGDRPLRFRTVHVVDRLDPAHRAWLGTVCRDIRSLALPAPPPSATERERAARILAGAVGARAAGPGRPLWTVIHSGPAVEVALLVDEARARAAASAQSPCIVVVTTADTAALLPGLGVPVVTGLDAPAVAPHADLLVTAAGWNTLNELRSYRARHHVVPFARRFDDQFARARDYGTIDPPR